MSKKNNNGIARVCQQPRLSAPCIELSEKWAQHFPVYNGKYEYRFRPRDHHREELAHNMGGSDISVLRNVINSGVPKDEISYVSLANVLTLTVIYFSFR